jgi:hypothetical protein
LKPDEVKAIAEQLQQGLSPSWLWYGLVLLLALLGGFLGAYLKEKGRSLATKEDYKVLLEQLKQTTKETETIKSEILQGSWAGQEKWKLKKEIYISILEKLQVRRDTLRQLMLEESRELPRDQPHLEVRYRFVEERRKATIDAMQTISLIQAYAGIVLSTEAVSALEELTRGWNPVVDAGASYEVSLKSADCVYELVLKAARADLGISTVHS